MRRLIIVTSLLFLSAVQSALAAPVFDFNNNCYTAYRQLMALKNEDANRTLKAELQANPENVIPVYLSDYQDCLQLLFNGDRKEFEQLRGNQDKRLDLLDDADKGSPWYLFCKANIHLHWALVHLRFGENLKAAGKFRKSLLLLQENRKKFPEFEENNVLLGLEQSIAGAVPENYKWIGSIFGITGNINKGVSSIVQYLNHHQDGHAPLHEEAMIYYVYLKFYLLNAPEVSWKFLNSGQYNETGNLMRSFIKANIALNYRKAENATLILRQAAAIKEYSRFPIMEYELAEAKLLQLDMGCAVHFKAFLENYKGTHFIKDSWLKLSWISFLKRDQESANALLSNVKSEGIAATDADKQALRFSENPIWPLPELLEVRLLIDGGSYNKALGKIQRIDKRQLKNASMSLEYNFRYGRIFEELGQSQQAFIFYDATIKAGRSMQDYYAARAALQKGLMYERLGKKAEANDHFKLCLSMRNHDMQSSIDQLAKAGLNRLGTE